jgi:acetyltransferase-like isoleucine patch superfamily enzyme
MLQHQKIALEEIGVTMKAPNCDIHFGYGKMSQICMEYGVSLQAGKFDVGKIGAYSYLGGGATIARNIRSIGRFCSIAPNLTAGLAERPTDFISSHRVLQGMFIDHLSDATEFLDRNRAAHQESRRIYNERYSDDVTKIDIGNDVWIGEGVLIRRGIKIGDGAIIASHSVVVKDVEPYTIMAGVAAKPVKRRFSKETCEKLLEGKWWNYGLAALDGVSFTDADRAADQILKNIKDNNLPLWKPPSKTVLTDGTVI